MVSKLHTYVEASLGPDPNSDYIIPFFAAIEAMDTAHNIIKPVHDFPVKPVPTVFNQKEEVAQKVLASVTIANGGLTIATSSIPGGAGNGVFAAADFEPDTLIYHNDKPLVRCPVLANTGLKCCGWCFRMDDANMMKASGILSRSPSVPGIFLKECPLCKKDVYCSPQCQRKAWDAGHINSCVPHPSSSSSSSAISPEMLLTAQVLHSMATGTITTEHKYQLEFLGSERWIGSDPLLPFGDPIYGDMSVRASTLQKMVPKSKQDSYSIKELFGRVATNFKVLETAYGGPIVAVLDILTGLLNHSCAPNVHLIWEGGRIEARSTTRIKAGDELFITYVNPLDWVLRRQITLLKVHHFSCRCSKCVADEQADIASGMLAAQQAKRWATLETLDRTWEKLNTTASRNGKGLKAADFERQLKQIEDTAGRKFPRNLEPMPSIYTDMSAWFMSVGAEALALKAAVRAFFALKGEHTRGMRYIQALKILALHLLPHPKLSLRSACKCKCKSKLKVKNSKSEDSCNKSHIAVDIEKPPMHEDFARDKISVSIVAYGYALWLSWEAERVLGLGNESQPALKMPALQCMAGSKGFFIPTDERFLKRFEGAQEKMLRWAGVEVEEGVELNGLVEKLRVEFASRGKDFEMGKIEDCMAEMGL